MSLDEVIAEELGEGGGASNSQGRGGSKTWYKEANYWDIENGWSIRTGSRPPPSAMGLPSSKGGNNGWDYSYDDDDFGGYWGAGKSGGWQEDSGASWGSSWSSGGGRWGSACGSWGSAGCWSSGNSWSSLGASGGWGSSGWRNSEAFARGGWGGGMLDGVRKRESPDTLPRRLHKRIKVTNIPEALPARDIRDAFEAATGKIEACELDKGTAVITFVSPQHAHKAAEVFDQGELNGNIIFVTQLP